MKKRRAYFDSQFEGIYCIIAEKVPQNECWMTGNIASTVKRYTVAGSGAQDPLLVTYILQRASIS